MKHFINSSLTIGLIVALVTTIQYAAPAARAAGPCNGGPIRVGAIATITGPIDLHQVPEAARAVFDAVNGAGGINGCPIEYIVEDDRGDPQLAAQAARNLVDNRRVDILVGSASLVDCQANAVFYERKGILALSGMGAEPACFKAKNILPLNVGPYALSTSMLSYTADVLKHDKICGFFVNFGGTAGAAYRQAVEGWERDHHRKLQLLDSSLPTQADFTPYVIRARDAGCQSVVSNLTESLTVQWIRTAERQRITGIDWFFLAPVYTESAAKAIGATTQKVYVLTEWEPLGGKESASADAWKRVMSKVGLPINQRTQAGFAAGTVLTQALKTSQKRQTRAEMVAAVKRAVMQREGLKADAIPMRAMKLVTLTDGDWRVLPVPALTPSRRAGV